MADYRIEVVSCKSLDEYIGQRLKARRTMMGISQTKLGESLGVTFQQIQKYEKGVNRISASMLYNISVILGVDFSYFVDGFHIKNADMLNDSAQASYEFSSEHKKETSNLLRAYYKISEPHVRRRVLELVRSVAVTAQQ